jgi:hypothetical protein
MSEALFIEREIFVAASAETAFKFLVDPAFMKLNSSPETAAC